ncbi:MAG: TolB family protein [Hydrococcus sp. C42_A2020_068]|uniref:TolB family protein n=1 Tax=Pleurocapsa sp. PCC 7327 TaxID=118163 RepID=UPI00029FA6C9|nr:TolB family protein [Pleurocapsa sp. PCC 7327]AFY76204.1 periplasmic component of the Tol biopolymer transport system [Pleurocapsa sp. PCC 7327]MBF2018984.1 TolB family protein [Hydrococcus sp. C42_A2020_068]
MKRPVLVLIVVLTSLLSSCTGYPRFLNFPFDPGGRSLNSPNSELSPQVNAPYIVFVSDRNGSQDVYLFDARRRQLIDLPGLNSLDEIASHPAISEDGRYIVFAGSRQGRADIYLYDRETQQKRNLTENLPAEVRNPTISTDGSRIAFEVAKNGQWDILVCDRNGQPLNIPGNAR